LRKYRKNATFYGKYEAEELHDLMGEVDWVIIPSTRWENSPPVIQESFKFGKPMIASDIGRMAEKVTDGKDGLHFKARNPRDLAKKISRVIREPELYDELYEGITMPISIEESVKEHLDIYRKG
jgi:glycosyltransferase involved in cell wall biosynthesis